MNEGKTIRDLRPSSETICANFIISFPYTAMVTTVESYRQAMAQIMLEQKRRHGKLPDPEYWTLPKQEDSPPPVKAQPTEKDNNYIAPKKPSKTFQLFIAHLQPKKKPPLRIQLLRRIYKRRKKLESSTMKVQRMRPSRVWEIT